MVYQNKLFIDQNVFWLQVFIGVWQGWLLQQVLMAVRQVPYSIMPSAASKPAVVERRFSLSKTAYKSKRYKRLLDSIIILSPKIQNSFFYYNMRQNQNMCTY